MNAPVIPSHHVNPTLASVGVLLASLVVAYGMDSILGQLGEQAQSTFHIIPGALFSAVMPLILTTMMLALAWVIFIKLHPNRAVAIIFLAAGCIIIGTYLTLFIGFPLQLRRTIIGRFRTAIMALGTHSSLYHLAAFWVVMGIACLLRRPLKTETTRVENQQKTAAYRLTSVSRDEGESD